MDEVQRQMKLMFNVPATVSYTNWKGDTAVRHIVPLHLWYGISPYHTKDGPQMYLEAHDIDKNDTRSFALKDIKPPA